MTLASEALAIARAGVQAADPGRAVRRTLRPVPGAVKVGDSALRVGPGGRIHLVAIGKAAGAMGDAARRLLGPDAEGIVVTPSGYPAPRSGLPVRFGEHPVPGPGSERAGLALLQRVEAADPDDAVLFLISGGGSAVAEAPVPGVSMGDLSRTTEGLLASGAPIGAMNAVRRHLSRIKGGRLAEASRAGRWATIALSDVVGDAPEDIASGPSVPDPSTYADAAAAVRRFDLGSRLPPPVVAWIEDGRRGRHPETPKAGAPRFRGAPFVLAASNRTAVAAAAEAARARGYRTEVLERPIVGETAPAGRGFARRLLRLGASGGPFALLGGGETTVTLGPHPGRGGRNQEFALAAAERVAGRPRTLVLSLGTDGIDGPTDAAGGWVDDRTAGRARARGVDLAAALRRHAAYDALDRLGGLLRTGATGTNVTDLHVGLIVAAVSRGRAGSSPRRAAPSSRRRRS